MRSLHDYLTGVDGFQASDISTCPSCGSSIENDLLDRDRLARCPVCAYILRRCALEINDFPSNDEAPSLPARYQRFWLKHCLSADLDYVFKVLEEVRSNGKDAICVDREEDVRKICKKHLAFNNAPLLTQYIGSPRGVAHYHDVVMAWFLRRYDWMDAFDARFKKRTLAFWLLFVPLFGMTAAYFLTLASTQLTSFLKWMELAGSVLFTSLFIGMLLSPAAARLAMPRLPGAVFVGLLPLAMTDTMWTFASRLPEWKLGLVCAMSFCLAVFYMVIEIRKVAGHHWLKALRRSVPIALYGLLASLTASLILYDLFSGYLTSADTLKELMLTAVGRGWSGPINCRVVLFFGTFSFMLGIFVQVFWEEKTITESL